MNALTMLQHVLTDPARTPTGAVLRAHLGGVFRLWNSFEAELTSEFSAAAFEWRFYNDGKCWLGKVTAKKKTLCWISVFENCFRVTFYFTSRNDEDIGGLRIGKRRKDRYFSAGATGKLKPFSVEVRTDSSLSDVLTLLRYKSSPEASRAASRPPGASGHMAG